MTCVSVILFGHSLLKSGTDLKRRAHEISGDGALIPGSNAELGVRGLGADLEIGVSEALSNSVNTNVVASL